MDDANQTPAVDACAKRRAQLDRLRRLGTTKGESPRTDHVCQCDMDCFKLFNIQCPGAALHQNTVARSSSENRVSSLIKDFRLAPPRSKQERKRLQAAKSGAQGTCSSRCPLMQITSLLHLLTQHAWSMQGLGLLSTLQQHHRNVSQKSPGNGFMTGMTCQQSHAVVLSMQIRKLHISGVNHCSHTFTRGQPTRYACL